MSRPGITKNRFAIGNLRGSQRRKGTAAVEAALLLPVVVFVFLGAIDIAQYINVSQVVTNASREGARIASRNSTETTDEVSNAVLDYLRDSFPQLNSSSFNNAAKVGISHDGAAIPAGNLNSVESGGQITVDVAFDFDAVRWLAGPNYWDGTNNRSTTFCRRQ